MEDVCTPRKSLDYEAFKILLTCCDWRLSDVIDSRSTKYKFLGAIREQERVTHLTYTVPLGVKIVFGFTRNKELAKLILEEPSGSPSLDADKMPFPQNMYLHSVGVLPEGRLFVSWYKPQGISIDAHKALEEVYEGVRLPVYNCVGRLDPELSRENVELESEVVDRLLKVDPVRVRMPFLAYVITAILDTYPMLSLNEVSKIVRNAEIRGIRFHEADAYLRMRYVQRYYRVLSEHYVVGRVMAYKPFYLQLALIAPRQCLREVYSFLALTFSASHLYVSGDVVFASFAVYNSDVVLALRKLYLACPSLHIVNVFRGLRYSFPYEYYDPYSGRWGYEPVKDVVELLRKFRLISREHFRGRSS